MRWDLIVVGAGTAGIPCACEAADRGARVLLLEAADDIGGALHVSGGHLSAGGTDRQRERGISDDPDRHFQDVLRVAGLSPALPRLELTRRVCEAAPATLAWLEGLGVEWAPETPRIVYGHEPYLTPRTVYGPAEGRTILAALRRLLAASDVELRLGARVTEVLPGSGVVVAGELLEAGDVVLATGGFAAAPALFAEIEQRPLVSAAWPTSTGDGLLLAREAGAAWAGQGTYLPTFGGLPAPDGSDRAVWHDRPLLTVERPPWEIYVSRAGRRWVAEDEPSIDAKERALMALPDLTFWTVFDARGVRSSHPIVVGWEPGELERQAGTRAGVSVADTLEELAGVTGIDPAGLRATVTRYNAAVSNGLDPDFGRRHLPAPLTEPPFYALENHGITIVTFTGVDVTDDLAVRRPDGSAIGGLWAVGEVLGAGAFNGNAFCSGMLITPALVLGRELGARLASVAA
jgi:glycine/D-amino acid oxidase-like deaminating enzyme